MDTNKYEIVKNFLLAGVKFMLEMHLKQPTYSACGPFSKSKERIQAIFTKMNLIRLVFNMI